MSTPDRMEQVHEEYLAEWVESNLRHLYEVCADLAPWSDAEPEGGSEKEGENSWVATPAGEDPAATAWQERGSSSEQSAA